MAASSKDLTLVSSFQAGVPEELINVNFVQSAFPNEPVLAKTHRADNEFITSFQITEEPILKANRQKNTHGPILEVNPDELKHQLMIIKRNIESILNQIQQVIFIHSESDLVYLSNLSNAFIENIKQYIYNTNQVAEIETTSRLQ